MLVATDRISAFDWVLPTGIPDKGRVLTQLSNFWFDELGEPNHILATDVEHMDELPPYADREMLSGRRFLVRKTSVVPIECVVRGYLAGSGWKEYQQHGTVCGIRLPPGLRESRKLPEPIFTPATKEESGHDENISFEQWSIWSGRELTEQLRDRSIKSIARCRLAGSGDHHRRHEVRMGPVDGRLVLIDEVLTRHFALLAGRPVSARRRAPRSTSSTCGTGWRRRIGTSSPPPELAEETVLRTREKYIEAYERLTSRSFPWR